MDKRSRILVCILVLLGTVPVWSDQLRETKTKEVMRRKLEHSQKVLEGIAVNDFDKITKGAEDLMLLSKSLQWKAINEPQYEVYSNQFRRSLDDLIEKSREKNLDGAALAYVDLTLNCVKCHKYVREVRKTGLDDPWPASRRLTSRPQAGGMP